MHAIHLARRIVRIVPFTGPCAFQGSLDPPCGFVPPPHPPRTQAHDEAANNVAGHIQRPENEVAGMLQLWQLAVRDMSCGRDPDWVGIRRMVLKTSPPYAEYIDSLINFVAEKAGGAGRRALARHSFLLAGQH